MRTHKIKGENNLPHNYLIFLDLIRAINTQSPAASPIPPKMLNVTINATHLLASLFFQLSLSLPSNLSSKSFITLNFV